MYQRASKSGKLLRGVAFGCAAAEEEGGLEWGQRKKEDAHDDGVQGLEGRGADARQGGGRAFSMCVCATVRPSVTS
jgi:hypothetical protein